MGAQRQDPKSRSCTHVIRHPSIHQIPPHHFFHRRLAVCVYDKTFWNWPANPNSHLLKQFRVANDLCTRFFTWKKRLMASSSIQHEPIIGLCSLWRSWKTRCHNMWNFGLVRQSFFVFRLQPLRPTSCKLSKTDRLRLLDVLVLQVSENVHFCEELSEMSQPPKA